MGANLLGLESIASTHFHFQLVLDVNYWMHAYEVDLKR